jgi:hypothetical protein
LQERTEPISVEPLSGITLLGRLLALSEKIRLVCKKPDKDKHSSFLQTFVKHGLKKFYNIGTSPMVEMNSLQKRIFWGKCYKAFLVRDLQIFIVSKSVCYVCQGQTL